jgi:hypothetical protein
MTEDEEAGAVLASGNPTGGKSSKHQLPSSREILSTKLQGLAVDLIQPCHVGIGLGLEVWSFSGGWSLEFGAS